MLNGVDISSHNGDLNGKIGNNPATITTITPSHVFTTQSNTWEIDAYYNAFIPFIR